MAPEHPSTATQVSGPKSRQDAWNIPPPAYCRRLVQCNQLGQKSAKKLRRFLERKQILLGLPGSQIMDVPVFFLPSTVWCGQPLSLPHPGSSQSISARNIRRNRRNSRRPEQACRSHHSSQRIYVLMILASSVLFTVSEVFTVTLPQLASLFLKNMFDYNHI